MSEGERRGRRGKEAGEEDEEIKGGGGEWRRIGRKMERVEMDARLMY